MLNADQEIPLTLTAAECNTVLAILAEQPWKIANPIITKLHAQIAAIDPSAFPAVEPPVMNGAAHVSD